MKSKKLVFICQAAVIAALYVVLTYVFSAFASGVIQVRVSEALTILPAFTPAAIPGLVIGCLLSNTLTGCVLLDIIFGSVATLIGALGLVCTSPPYMAGANSANCFQYDYRAICPSLRLWCHRCISFYDSNRWRRRNYFLLFTWYAFIWSTKKNEPFTVLKTFSGIDFYAL